MNTNRGVQQFATFLFTHDDVLKWKHFPRYWPCVWRIHRSPVSSTHKGQWRGILMFGLICAWMDGWVNNREAGDLRRHRVHYDVTVMLTVCMVFFALMDYILDGSMISPWSPAPEISLTSIKLRAWLNNYIYIRYRVYLLICALTSMAV